MSGSPHRLLHDLYRGPKLIADPGDGGTIRANADLQICEMTSGASNETRVIANPTKPGIRFILRLKTDGGGDVVVSASNGFNSVPEVSATFADAGDVMSMISVSLTATTYRWEVLDREGAALATSTATATSTPTSTSTATSTATSSSTQSISGSDTASGTFSASSSATSTRTATSTPTSTSTATATATGTQ